MQVALDEARAALEHDDVPVGAVVARCRDGEVLAAPAQRARAHRRPDRARRDARAARRVGRVGGWRLDGCVLVVTLEPCAMCAGAIVNARVPVLVYGATDPKAGAVASLYEIATDPRLNHRVEVHDGIRADECGALLKDFFAARRGGDPKGRRRNPIGRMAGGGVRERPNRMVSKTIVGQPTLGSNPSPSAKMRVRSHRRRRRLVRRTDIRCPQPETRLGEPARRRRAAGARAPAGTSRSACRPSPEREVSVRRCSVRPRAW